jgi:putative SOS response-associated peptidase YedK
MLAAARWGMPSSSKALMDATKKRAEKLQAKGKTVDFTELLRVEPDGGTTNIRNVKSKHWTRWLGTEHRCVVPFNSFSEFNKTEGGDIWFALDEGRPLACFDDANALRPALDQAEGDQHACRSPVCTENLIRVDDVKKSPKVAE